jgi:hypothetical protein
LKLPKLKVEVFYGLKNSTDIVQKRKNEVKIPGPRDALAEQICCEPDHARDRKTPQSILDSTKNRIPLCNSLLDHIIDIDEIRDNLWQLAFKRSNWMRNRIPWSMHAPHQCTHLKFHFEGIQTFIKNQPFNILS